MYKIKNNKLNKYFIKNEFTYHKNSSDSKRNF